MAAGGAQQPTVSLPALRNLVIENFIDPNFDRFNAFLRSIKVFQKSYGHYNLFYPNIYNHMWTEYWNEMTHLYDVANDPRLANINLNHIFTELSAEPIRMTAGIAQMVQTTPKWVQAQCRVNFHQFQGAIPSTFTLDHTKREQMNLFTVFTLTRQELYGSFQNNWAFQLRYAEKDNPNDQYTFYDYHVYYTQIHAEGLHKWLRFGNTKILLILEFKSRETNYNELTVNGFHQNTILYAIQRRLTAFRAVPNNDTHIHRQSVKRHVTYDLQEIDPQTRNAFWNVVPDRTQNDATPGRVKYADFQIGFSFGDELSGVTTCTCNEFCNLNAFFYYNPIYRFVLVQHSRHYLRNQTTVANMYQLALTHCLTPTVPMQSTPIFDLLISASDTLNANHVTFIQKPALMHSWRSVTPEGKQLEGMAYMILSRLNLCDLLFATYDQCFHESAFSNIHGIISVMYNLHRRIEMYAQFVPQNKTTRKRWVREFEMISRFQYFLYIGRSLTTMLLNVNQTYGDRLFTSDFEEKTTATKHNQMTQVNNWRQLQHPNNSLNILFDIKSFIHSINQLWTSLTRFEPMSAIYSRPALQHQYNAYKILSDMIQIELNVQNLVTHRVRLNAPALHQNFAQDLAHIKEPFRLFYKLKLYSRVFKIQNKFLESLFEYNAKLDVVDTHAFVSFEVIWNYQWIEDSPIHPPLPILFQRNDTVATLIPEFYIVFWRRAAHDRIAPPPTMDEVRQSVYYEYAKRRFWDRIDGNNRESFRNIIQEYENSVNACITQCRTVYDTHIMTTMQELRTYYFIREVYYTSETDKKYSIVMDELVYWLVRATCYMIVGCVATFLKSIDSLKNGQLKARACQYFLSKPGLVPLFQTKNMVFRILDRLENDYIAFCNPFDNIFRAIEETKHNIKNLYKNYYREMLNDLPMEFGQLFANPSITFEPMITFNLISGTAFLISIIDQSRKDVCYIRKRLKGIRNSRVLITVNIHYYYRRTWDELELWLTNINPLELARPFTVPRFQTLCPQLFAAMDAIDFAYLQNGAGALLI